MARLSFAQQQALLASLAPDELEARMLGAYQDPMFVFPGLEDAISLAVVIDYLLRNVGGGGTDLSTLPEYASDADAAAGGLSLDQPYQLAAGNIYGMKWGTIVLRKE